MNIKEKSALCGLEFIKEGMIVGLGGGSTIGYLARYIKSNNVNVKIVTPSATTKILCHQLGLNVLDLMFVDHIDVAFDGCDECDESLRALKSGGGIHSQEKLIGKMADEYILLVDESKISNTLTYKAPVVLEVMPLAYQYICHVFKQKGLQVVMKTAPLKDGFIFSDQGLLLLEVQPTNEDPVEFYNFIKNIPGVLDCSLFIDVVTKIIVTNDKSSRIIENKNIH